MAHILHKKAPADLPHSAASLAPPEEGPWTRAGKIAPRAASAPPQARVNAAERLLKHGIRLLERGKFAAAIHSLRQAGALDPRRAEVAHALGRALLGAGRLVEATDSLRLALLLDEGLAAAHFDLAIALEALGHGREAMSSCRRAIGLAPEIAAFHRLLGDLLESVGERFDAADCFRKAAAIAPDTAEASLDLARAHLLRGDPDGAEAVLRRAIVREPERDEHHKVLGEVLAKQGRFAEAIAACDRALELNALQVPAHLTAARAVKGSEADRPRLRRIVAALRDPSVTDAHRLFLHFAAGKLLDDLGDYQEAMQHFDKANAIRRRTVRFDRAGLAEVIDRLIQRFTPALFAANGAFGSDDETPLLIVGMPRSGTTLVEQIISSHPKIAAGEELFYWSNRASTRGMAEASSLTPESSRALAAEYVSLLRRIGPSEARVTDKQPFNFQQLGLIHLLLPKARFIHCRRHPVDTCLSMYFTFFEGRIPFVSDKADLAFAYHQYARIMDHWRAVLPADRFLEIDYEMLVADRERVTRQLIAFSGLGWDDACLRPERNARTVSTASLWQARQPVFATSVERWRRYEPWLGELRQLLEPSRT